MKEIPIAKYVSVKHEASITEFEGGIFVFENEDASGNTHTKRFKSLKDAVSAYERVFNCKIDTMEWDLEFDFYIYE